MELLDRLRDLEQQLTDPAVRRNPDDIESLLSPDFREFGAAGRILSRTETLAALASEETVRRRARDFHLTELAPGTALLTYQLTRTLAGEPTQRSLRSSLWRLEDGQWRMLFHQGTLVP